MPALREHTRQGLHLGWIPNDPGKRPRDFAEKPPARAAADPRMERGVRDAKARAAGWVRLLAVIGLLALLLCGVVVAISHRGWFWGVAAGIAVACWGTAGYIGWAYRKALAGQRRDEAERERRHAAELAKYDERKAAWQASEAERVARAPQWLRVTSHEGIDRLDVFGGTVAGRRNMLAGAGLSLLREHAVIVLDLSADRLCEGLLAAASQDGTRSRAWWLPRDLRATPLLSGLSPDQIASQIVEVANADDQRATAAGRAADLLVLNKINRVLGDDVTMERLHESLCYLLGDTIPADGRLSEPERERLAQAFGEGLRREVAGTLIRLAGVVDPLRDLGACAAVTEPARLTCLSLEEGPRDVTADLIAALMVQWATQAVVSAADGFRPGVIVAGADEQDRRHLARLVAACERHGVPLIRTFSRLTEDSARHLDSRNTAFMRLPTRPEAVRAAEHIGLSRRFVASRLAVSQQVSRSRTKTVGESVTHTTGTSEGGSVTRTAGTTEGESYTETEMPFRRQNVTVNVHNNTNVQSNSNVRNNMNLRDIGNADNSKKRKKPEDDKKDGSRDGSRKGGLFGGGQRDRRETGWFAGSGSNTNKIDQGHSKVTFGDSRRKRDLKPDGIDIVKSRTKFSARHQSESKTKSWEKMEQTSRTKTESRSRTEGTSVGDEITYDLTYEHKVAPETLMDLPDDQMLAPHIVEPAAIGQGESRMVALVVDPGIVGLELAAPVTPDEIPAFEAAPVALPEGVSREGAVRRVT